MENKRRSKLAKWGAVILARAWHVRYALAVGLGYAVLLGLLLIGDSPELGSALFEISDPPGWSAPGADFQFGKNGAGIDLFQLSRVGMAFSVRFAVISSLAGVFVALLIATITAMGKWGGRFQFLQRISFHALLLPGFLVVLIVAAGSEGNVYAVMTSLALVVGFSLVGVIGVWYEDCESGGDVLAGMALGMTRLALVRKRSLPLVTKKCLALIAGLIPLLIAVEMALSFLGLMADRISCGRIIAAGRDYLVEAPWISIYPGILATFVLIALSGLSWCVARLAKVNVTSCVF